ncbi:MAG: alpha/beta fold hydrolase [Actinomycetota bacterium]
MPDTGRLVAIDDTSLWVVTRGDGPLHLFVLHGGPGLDHHEFADYLDPLGDLCTLHLVDQRAQGRSDRDAPEHTWTLERMAQDVTMLALAMGLARYAVFGHSYGAFVTLQHAIDHPGHAAASIVCCGAPATRFLEAAEAHLRAVEPPELRARIERAFADETTVDTPERFAAMMEAGAPFYFRDLRDPRIDDYLRRTKDTVYAPEITRAVSSAGYAIELEDRLAEVANPVLVLGGRYDRVCPPEASEVTARGITGASLRIFEASGHFPFVEEPEACLDAIRAFLEPIARATR